MKSKKEENFLIEGQPTKTGRWLVRINSEEPFEIDVYRHPVKGICCFNEEFGSEGTGVDDRYDCHVSVQNTGLTFIRRIGINKTRKQL